jgi:glutamate carboxypeptidase
MIEQSLSYLRAHADEMRADLRALVELESPSDDPIALRYCAAWIAESARDLTGGQVRVVEQPEGPHLDIVFDGPSRPAVLLLGHFDTVWPIGTIAARPYREDDGLARGPGAFDMKAGIVQGLWAIQALHAVRRGMPAFRFLLTSDEELQSKRSRSLIEVAARDACAVLVLEPSLDGALKTSRKGVGRFEVTIRGRAAHAGVDPEVGRSAVDELARVIGYLHGLTDAKTGTTVNVGVVRGGTRANVVAAEAHAIVDVRVKSQIEAERVASLVRGMTPSRDGIEFDISGDFARPPMERTPQVAGLFASAQRLGERIGLRLSEASTGGGSDANFCAALGIPVLDGLGAVGGGAHAVDEYVVTECMAPRAALVAGLIDACHCERWRS